MLNDFYGDGSSNDEDDYFDKSRKNLDIEV